MKLLYVIKNYIPNIKKKNIEKYKKKIYKEPIFFLKPDTSLLRPGENFIIPEFTNEIKYEIEIVLKISKAGKYIQKKFAYRYYNEISLGIDFTAYDIYKKLKKKRFPWEKSKVFDKSTVVGKWISKKEFNNNILNFYLKRNNKTIQKGKTSDMIFSFEILISELSKYLSLKIGDLIFTGTPSNIKTGKKNDILEGFLEKKKLLQLKII